MKYFSKLLSMFLVGMVLVSVGCTDYDEQIRDLHNKIDQNQTDITEKVDAEINALEADLAQVKADLEAALEAMKNELSTKHKEDVDALKAVDAELDGKIAAANDAIKALEGELAKEVSRLEGEIDTLEAALEAAKKELADAIKAGDDAVKAELTKKITDLETDLLAKINDLQTKLEGDIENLRKDMQDKIDAANDAIDEANDKIDALELRADATEADVDALQADIADIEKEIADNKAALEQAIKDGDAAVKAELEAKIAALESELKGKIAALEAQDKLFAEQLKELEENLNTLSDRVTANYNELKADLAALETKLQAQIDANKRAIEENALDIVALQAQAEGIIKDVEAVRNNVANVEKALVAHIEEFAAYQAAIAGKIAYIESHISALEEQVAAIEALLPEMQAQIDANKELAQQNAADIAKNEALFEAYKQAVANTFDQLTKADAALAATLAALADDVAELDGELAALVSDFETYKANVDSQLSDCFAGLDNLEADLDAVNKSLSSQIAANKVQTEALQAQVTAIWAVLTQYQNKLNEEIANREAADANILKLLNDKYNELDAEYDARCNKLAEDLETLDGAFKEYKESMVKVIEQLTLTLRQEIADSEVRANKYTDIEVGKLKDYTDKKLDEVNLEIKGLKEEILNLQKGLMTAYNQLNTTMYELYVQCLNVINARVAELQIQIDELVNRVQSIVFVPENAERVIYIETLWATDAQKEPVMLSPGKAVATFRVTPVEAASQIVDYWKKDNSIFSIEGETITRAGLGSEYFNIVDVKLDQVNNNGRFIVTFNPVLPEGNFANVFAGILPGADSNEGLAVALRFNKNFEADSQANANLVSDYINIEYAEYDPELSLQIDGLVLANASTLFNYPIVFNGEFVPANEADEAREGYDIMFDDVKTQVTLFNGWAARIAYDDKYYTSEELTEELMMEVPAIEYACNHLVVDKSKNVTAWTEDNTGNFAIAPAVEETPAYAELVSLEEANKDYCRYTLRNELKASLVGYSEVSAVFFQNVNNVRTTAEITADKVDYVWKFSDFEEIARRASDNVYEGNTALRFDVKKSEGALPASILGEDVITYWDAKTKSIEAYELKDGAWVATTDELVFKPTKFDENGALVEYSLGGWKFGKEYKFTVLVEFDTFDVEFKDFVFAAEDLEKTATIEDTVEFEFDFQKKHYAEDLTKNFFNKLWENNPQFKDNFVDEEQFVNAMLSTDDPNYIPGEVDYSSKKNDGEAKTKTLTNINVDPTSEAFYTFTRVDRVTNLDTNLTTSTWSVRISSSEIDSEKDVFDLETVLNAEFQNKGIEITAAVTATVKMPEYIVNHSSVWVREIGDSYATDVIGNWTPSFNKLAALEAFSTSKVQLPDAFIIYKKVGDDYEPVSADDIAAQNMVMTFEVKDVVLDDYKGYKFPANLDDAQKVKYLMEGIALNNSDEVIDGKTYVANQILSYNGKAKSVGVNGTLTVGNIVIENAFSKYTDNYDVLQYDPIGEWNYINTEKSKIDTKSLAAEYDFNLFELLSLKDKRGCELIDPLASDVTSPWIVGDGLNGFATGLSAGDCFLMTKSDYPKYGVTFGDYRLSDNANPESTDVVVGAIQEKLEMEKDANGNYTGYLTFKNMNQMAIQKDLFVKVPVTVEYPWGRKDGTIVITILKNTENAQ